MLDFIPFARARRQVGDFNALQQLGRADLGQVAADIGGQVAGEGGEQHAITAARFIWLRIS